MFQRNYFYFYCSVVLLTFFELALTKFPLLYSFLILKERGGLLVLFRYILLGISYVLQIIYEHLGVPKKKYIENNETQVRTQYGYEKKLSI